MKSIKKQHGETSFYTLAGCVILVLMVLAFVTPTSPEVSATAQTAQTAETVETVETVEEPPFHKKYFDNVYDSNEGRTFLAGEGNRLETASILIAPDNKGRALMITAYFYPVKMVRIEVDGATEDKVYAYSEAPVEYQSLWDTLYAQAVEVGEGYESWYVPGLYSGEAVLSTEKYEARILELETVISGLQETISTQSAENVSLNKALELLKAELDQVTTQRDAYKAHIDKMVNSIPTFNE